MNDYPELTAEEYRQKITEIIANIDNEKFLRRIFICVGDFVTEKGGAC